MLQVKIVPVTAFAQNCSLVWDSETKEAVLIDAGGDAAVLKKEVEALGLKVKGVMAYSWAFRSRWGCR